MNARNVILSVLLVGAAVVVIVLLRQKPGPPQDMQPGHVEEEDRTVERVASAEPSKPEKLPIDVSSVETGLPVNPSPETPAKVEHRTPPTEKPVAAPVTAPVVAPVAEIPGRTRTVPGATVARAVFTTGVSGREPIDTVTAVGILAREIYFFTDIRNCTDDAVTHRWIYRGNTMAEVRLSVGGPRWRTWSSKNLLPEWSGRWSVEVVDAAGTVLLTRSFDYGH